MKLFFQMINVSNVRNSNTVMTQFLNANTTVNPYWTAAYRTSDDIIAMI